MSRRAKRLARKARELAAEGREDVEAVDELVALAKRRHGDLQAARSRWRVDGMSSERAVPNRSVRLLEAALEGGPVRPPEPAVRDRIETLERLDSLPLDEAFTELSRRDPRLRDLERQARDSATRHRAQEFEDLSGGAETETDTDAERYSTDAEIFVVRELESLLGGGAGVSDPILGSATAHLVARNYLNSLSN
jgi:hypothetical protein